jgi:hypothetical protein
MSRTGTLALAAGLAWLATADARANQDAVLDRFTSIPQRNAFGLKPPAPVVPVEVKAPPPAVTVQLTGIITLLSNKKAILVVNQQGKAPESKVMAENQSEGVVEVKEINAEAGTVKLVVSGNEVELNFEKNGVKPPSGAAPGNPALAGAGSTATALFSGAATAKTDDKSIGSPAQAGSLASFLRQASATSSTKANTLTPMGGVPGMGGVGSPIAGQAFRFDGAANAGQLQPKWPPETPVTREESEIYIEIARELNKNSKIPMPPMPPTAINPNQPPPLPEP